VETGPDATVLINLSGRGDKDMGTAIEYFGLGDPDEVTEEPVGEPGEDLR
jgi:tryptophan synthase beta chain